MRLIIDFDGTITRHDTLSLIASTAASCLHQPLLSPPTIPFDGLPSVYQDSWDSVVTAYLTDLSTSHLTRREIESVSLDRVASTQVLRGATRHRLRETGRQVATREGWVEAAEWFKTFPVIVATLNWSMDVVVGCLEKVVGFGTVRVVGNDLEFDEMGGATGVVGGGLLVGEDKVEKLEREVGVFPGGGLGDPVVYIGDGTADVPCFAWSDLAIHLVPEPSQEPSDSFKKACKEAGLVLQSVSTLTKSEWTDRVFVATSWLEVLKSLQEISPTSTKKEPR
ncbi:hypothetical protein HDU67_006092 [Dinochytrium kinnereticum]|nr:hypothetical protein HDU67_006092 [Dinochytrium kinnereticum]